MLRSKQQALAPETRRLKKIGSNSRGDSREYSMKFAGRKILPLAALLPCVASFLPQHGSRQNGNQMEGHSSLVLRSKRNRSRNPPREEPTRTEDSTSSLFPVTPRKFAINLAATVIGALVGNALLSDDYQRFFLGPERYDQGYRVVVTLKSCREIDQEPNSSLSSCKCLYGKGTYSVRYCKVDEDEVRSQPNNQVE